MARHIGHRWLTGLVGVLGASCAPSEHHPTPRDPGPCDGVTFTEAETEAAVGYSAADLLAVREWEFTQAIPVLATTLDEEALTEAPRTSAHVRFAPDHVEAGAIVSGWAGETYGWCVPDFLVNGQASLDAPDIDLSFEGAVTMNRVLTQEAPAGERPQNHTSFDVSLFSEDPDLPDLWGIDPSDASARLHLQDDLATAGSGGLVKARLTDRDYFYLYWAPWL